MYQTAGLVQERCGRRHHLLVWLGEAKGRDHMKAAASYQIGPKREHGHVTSVNSNGEECFVEICDGDAEEDILIECKKMQR